MLVDVDLVNEPVDLSDFELIKGNQYPLALCGFILKNKYDQDRLKIRSIYKPKKYIHFLDNSTTPKIFYGIPIKLIDSNILSKFNSFEVSITNLVREDYSEFLSSLGLSCSECFGELYKGVYPVDNACISKLTKQFSSIEDLYSTLEHNSPPFQSFGYFTIFILTNNYYKKFNVDDFIKYINNHKNQYFRAE